MSYSVTNPSTTAYDPEHKLPQHLDHKPVYALPYQHFDGIHAGKDARYISVGISQNDSKEVSIKIMRHTSATGTGGRWSRQAEELPLHRPIDMTLFLVKVIFDSAKEGSIDIPENVFIPKNVFKNQNSDIKITKERRSVSEMDSYEKFLLGNNSKNSNELKEHFNKLRDVLNGLKCRGKI